MFSNAQLVATQVGFSYGPRRILHEISLTVAPGDRIGVVGANGTGKTTLLRILAGQLEASSGAVATTPPGASVGLLRQQLDDRHDETVGRFIRRKTGIAAVIADFEAAVHGLSTAEAGADSRYDDALSRYLLVDAATIDERAGRVLTDVGLDSVGPERRTRELSGGQRTRVNLAALLLAAFDILLLDEPTNDLDLNGLALVEHMMRTDERPTVIVSHDRAFLEQVTTSIYELDDHTHTGTRFNGGYAAWEHDREVARQHHAEAFSEYTEKRKRLQERATRQRQWSAAGAKRAKRDRSEKDRSIRAYRIEASENLAGKAKQTEQALERLERNEKVDAPWQPWELRLRFAAGPRSSDEVAVLEDAVVERGNFTLGPISVTLMAGDRVMITGENGSGKTTLLQALLGEVALTAGRGRVGPAVRVATLRQSRELFADSPSLLRGFAEEADCDDQQARSQLAKLGLDVERIDRPVVDLSPGERTRAALGLFAARDANVLVLDEPTNHLDLPAIEQLEAALDVFPHTVLLVTHDRRLRDNTTTNLHWHLDAGQLSVR